MRLFQNSGLYPAYRAHFERIAGRRTGFTERVEAFLDDRFGACHFLKPVLERQPEAFFTNGDDEVLQQAWAREHGLAASADAVTILLAQIEAHRTEVFYNLDPMRFGSDFVRRLPACVKRKICWRAAPSPGADFAAYDMVLCNFPGIIEMWRSHGLRAEYFAPAHDPRMDAFADGGERPIDVLFVGGYSRHHTRRARVLEAVASLADRHRVMFCLDRSRLTRLAESPVGILPPLRQHRRPAAIRRVSAEPVFGIELYKLLAQSKIVLNGAIDMAGEDRGNMRCFEAIGCGALLVSDHGHYPEGMVMDQTMLGYGSAEEAVSTLSAVLAAWPRHREMAERGRAMIRSVYSKEAQWERFQQLLALA